MTLSFYPCVCVGVLDYLTTEVSTSRSRKFNLVAFVDTPGLVDGDMNYPFDVNETLLWLGKFSSCFIRSSCMTHPSEQSERGIHETSEGFCSHVTT